MYNISTESINFIKKHSLQGSMSGEVGYITSSFISIPTLDKNPFFNRVIDSGISNMWQDQLWSRFPVDYNGITDNEIYLGTLQTIKFLSGIEMSNYALNHILKHKAITPVDNFIVTAIRMTAFFTAGKLEVKFISEESKWAYIGTVYSGFAGYYYFSAMKTQVAENTGAIYLSLFGFIGTTAGLWASFMTPHLLHEVGIDINREFELNKTLALKTSIIGSALILSGGNPFSVIPAGALITIEAGALDDVFIYAESEKICGFAVANIATLLFLTSSTAYSNGYNNAKIGCVKVFATAFGSALGAVNAELIYMLMEKVSDLIQPAFEYIKEATIDTIVAEILLGVSSDGQMLCD